MVEERDETGTRKGSESYPLLVVEVTQPTMGLVLVLRSRKEREWKTFYLVHLWTGGLSCLLTEAGRHDEIVLWSLTH